MFEFLINVKRTIRMRLNLKSFMNVIRTLFNYCKRSKNVILRSFLLQKLYFLKYLHNKYAEFSAALNLI